MFTGIVEELGTVVALDWQGDSARLTLRGPVVTADARAGDSIAVSGVCLTVVAVEGEEFSADVMKETFDRSALGSLTPGERVNLERAVTPTTRLGGHIVQGHVDGVGVVLDRHEQPRWTVVRLALPVALRPYVVAKGSIAVDGISLTVAAVGDDWFEVSLIPTTVERTTVGHKRVGSMVNLEVDVIAKYVEKMLRAGSVA